MPRKKKAPATTVTAAGPDASTTVATDAAVDGPTLLVGDDVAAGAVGLAISEDAIPLTDPCVRCGIAAKVQDGDRVVCTYCGAE